MKVLCFLTLLMTADGNLDFSEIIAEIFGTQNSTSIATKNDLNSTAIATKKSKHRLADFDTLRKIFAQTSKSQSRLHISVANSKAKLNDYSKEYLQTLLGDWTLIKFYARTMPNKRDIAAFNNCIKIRLAPSKGICKCQGKNLPVFNTAITCENPKIKYIKDVAVAFVSHFKDAIKFGNTLCKCKRMVITGRVLSNNYIILYDNVSNKTDIAYFVILARNHSALWELENFEETSPELVHRKSVVLCEGIVLFTTLKSVGSVKKINFEKPKLGFGLSALSFFDYLNTIPRQEFLDIAFTSGVAI